MIFGMVVPETGWFAGREVGWIGKSPHSGRYKTVLTGHYKPSVKRTFVFWTLGFK
jgi:hypothetical protein